MEDISGAVGYTLPEIEMHLPHSTAIGMVRNGIPLINPDVTATVLEGDQLIVIAHDDETTRLEDPASIDEDVFQREAAPAEEPTGCRQRTLDVSAEPPWGQREYTLCPSH